jgi:mannose-6-phosphate isomerase-like protein (cupin superfamily)
MPDVQVKNPDELESYGGRFLYAGRGLGVQSFGMNLLRLPANWSDYPLHDHEKDGQEEVYVILEGSARLEADGRTWDLTRGTMARVGPATKRKITPGPEGVTILALGGIAGKPYEPRR